MSACQGAAVDDSWTYAELVVGRSGWSVDLHTV